MMIRIKYYFVSFLLWLIQSKNALFGKRQSQPETLEEQIRARRRLEQEQEEPFMSIVNACLQIATWALFYWLIYVLLF